MKILIRYSFITIFLISSYLAGAQENPDPVDPLPSQRQLDWHEMEYYGFVHFNMNTFTNMEWGEGGESPEKFNFIDRECRIWGSILK